MPPPSSRPNCEKWEPQQQRRVWRADALVMCDLLDIILRDEVGHVAIGNHWYAWLCARQKLDPIAHYKVLARHHAPQTQTPFNQEARRQAGFSDENWHFAHRRRLNWYFPYVNIKKNMGYVPMISQLPDKMRKSLVIA